LTGNSKITSARRTVEDSFATIKYRIFAYPCLLMCGLSDAKIEIRLNNRRT